MSRGDDEAARFMIRTIERAKDHYDVLQLDKDADAKTIRTTMRDILRKIHPDKCGSAGEAATKRVNEACDVLKDPDARAAYDLELKQEESPKKPKAKPKAKKPAAKPKARAASPKRATPEDDDEPAPKPKRGRKAEAEAPAPAPAPAAAPAAAPRPYMGSCTCRVLTQSN